MFNSTTSCEPLTHVDDGLSVTVALGKAPTLAAVVKIHIAAIVTAPNKGFVPDRVMASYLRTNQLAASAIANTAHEFQLRRKL
jgi:hypothetical protein